jgi:hypothetical protein
MAAAATIAAIVMRVVLMIDSFSSVHFSERPSLLMHIKLMQVFSRHDR